MNRPAEDNLKMSRRNTSLASSQPLHNILRQEIQRKAKREISRYVKKALADRQNPPLKIRLSSRPARPVLYFLTPDHNYPAGGIKVIYRHVDILNEAGIEAAVMHQGREFRCNWFDNRTRVTDIHSTAVGPDDVLVVSELNVNDLAKSYRDVRHIVLNQSGHLTWKRSEEKVAEHYLTSKSLLGIIVVSDHIAQMLAYAYPQRRIRSVRNGIDAELFYTPAEKTHRQITCFPRRGKEDLAIVLQLLRARGVLNGWDVRALDGLSLEAFAAGLRAGSITLSLSYQEGFGLPAAEAMACGNYVIGYHAFGGREFMKPEFSCPVEPGDVMGVASNLERIINAVAGDDDWCARRGRLASEFVLDRYSLKRERESVVTAYADLVASC